MRLFGKTLTTLSINVRKRELGTKALKSALILDFNGKIPQANETEPA